MTNTHPFDPSYARPARVDRCCVCGQPRTAVAHRMSPGDAARKHLLLANAMRLAGAGVKRDVREGRLTADVALFDVRADSLEVLDLLVSAPGWSRARAEMLLDGMRISHLKRVRHLTCRQRDLIAQHLAPRRNAA